MITDPEQQVFFAVGTYSSSIIYQIPISTIPTYIAIFSFEEFVFF